MKKRQKQLDEEYDYPQPMMLGSYQSSPKSGQVKTRQIGFVVKQQPVKRQPKRK
jgi:hypothetical protein